VSLNPHPGGKQLVLRRGTRADAEEIEAVHWFSLEAAYLGRLRGWPETPRDIGDRLKRWRSWLSDTAIDVIVGVEGHSIVGFATLCRGRDPDLDPVTAGEIPTLYVNPEHWRKGYGRSLCEEALRLAAHRGFESVVLWVVDINERARLFYQQLGFAPDGAVTLTGPSADRVTARRYRVSLRGAL